MAKLALWFSFFSLYHSKQKLSVMGDSFCIHNNNATKFTLQIKFVQSLIVYDTTLSKKNLLN